MASVLFVVSGGSYAGDCSPGSLLYKDTFFKICDAARGMDAREAIAAEKKPDVDSGKKQSSAGLDRGDRTSAGVSSLDR